MFLQVGSYSVAVLHQGAPISGTPYTVEAADPQRVTLQSAGECYSTHECALKVDASGQYVCIEGVGLWHATTHTNSNDVRVSIWEFPK